MIIISKYHSTIIPMMVNILACARGTYLHVGVSPFRKLGPVICSICQMKIHAKQYTILWLIANRAPLRAYPEHRERVAIRAKLPSCGRSFVVFEWWQVSKCLRPNKSPRALAPSLKFKPRASLPHTSASVTSTLTLWHWKSPSGPFLLPKFPLAYQNFYAVWRRFLLWKKFFCLFYHSKTESRKLFASSSRCLNPIRGELYSI